MPYDFPVEPGRIHSFALSVGDDDRVFVDQLFDGAPGTPLVTPPTFTRSAEHFDPDRHAALVGSPTDREVGGFRDAVHAEQHFEYVAPFTRGDRVTVTTTPGRTWHKQGRSGDLEFYEIVTDFTAPSGALLVRARKVSVRLGRGSEPTSAAQQAPTKQRPPGRPAPSEGWGGPWRAGQTCTAPLADALSRMHIARYAGAAGDYNLVHVDEEFATQEAGRPSVLAHGMLTMGLVATFVTGLVGRDLRTFGGRFVAPVLPGQRLSATATVAEVVDHDEQRQVRLEVRALADDRPVFEGYAEATVV